MKYKDVLNSVIAKTSNQPLVDVVATIAFMLINVIWFLYENEKLTENQVRNILGD